MGTLIVVGLGAPVNAFVVMMSKSVIIRSSVQSPRKMIEKHIPGSRSAVVPSWSLLIDETEDRPLLKLPALFLPD